MFSIVFPLCPLFGFINNRFEIRIDAKKLIRNTQRSFCENNKNIGSVQNFIIYLN